MTSSAHEPTRRSYDAVAENYAEEFGDELARKLLDRSLLGALLESAGADATVADLGCGPGHVAAWLSARGANAIGVDLSPEMVDVGRRRYPDVDFRVGDLLALPIDDRSCDAVVAFYSLIHLEPDELGPACQEIHRVLRPGGSSLVAFHIGDDVVHRDEWWGHDVNLDFRFFQPDVVARALEEVGLVVQARLERIAYPGEVDTRRCYLWSARPGG